MARRLPSRPPKQTKIIKNLKENDRFLLVRPCPRMPPKSSPRPPKTSPKSTSLGPRCPQDFPSSAQDAQLDALMEHLGPSLEPSRPRFSINLGTFCKYFKRCFAHCVRPPTCSFDASGQRFSFILVPFPAYFQHVLYMFRGVICMPCAI